MGTDTEYNRLSGLQPIRWISRQTLKRDSLARRENLRPIRIRAGALGSHGPENGEATHQKRCETGCCLTPRPDRGYVRSIGRVYPLIGKIHRLPHDRRRDGQGG
ncbi:Hint domain-containing protein [Paracoccus seriniphilus]|uniref:Hint domain-containing protein n=1 Tax=Paracoccus seriniphilus TaxID=184748 RepID=UPI0035625ED3